MKDLLCKFCFCSAGSSLVWWTKRIHFSMLDLGLLKCYLERCYRLTPFLDTYISLFKTYQMTCLKKMPSPLALTTTTQTSWDQMELRVGRINNSPRKKLNSEAGPTEHLPENNSSSSEESKDRSNENLHLSRWKDSSLIPKPSFPCGKRDWEGRGDLSSLS